MRLLRRPRMCEFAGLEDSEVERCLLGAQTILDENLLKHRKILSYCLFLRQVFSAYKSHKIINESSTVLHFRQSMPHWRHAKDLHSMPSSIRGHRGRP